MKKILLAASVAALLSVPVQADMLFGLYLGGEVWQTAPSGTFGDSSTMVDFGLDNEQQTSFHVALEHPIPLIPNIRIAAATLNSEGSTTLSEAYSFAGQTFDVDEVTTTEIEMNFIDFTLYYEILDNDLVTVDVGLTARNFSGDISVAGKVSNVEDTKKLDVSLPLPMVYGSVIVGLPFTGFNVFAQGNAISYSGQSIYDVQAGIGYELLDNLVVDVNINLGYRIAKLDINDLENISTDLTFEGVYLGTTVHF